MSRIEQALAFAFMLAAGFVCMAAESIVTFIGF